jgi:hypothetical protein
MKIEVRRFEGATWVKLVVGLAVVPVGLLDELREVWSGKLADAVMEGKAMVNVGLDGHGTRMDE